MNHINGKLRMRIPVYVSACIYTIYLTLFPEVMKQELPCSFLSFPALLHSFGNFGSVKKYNHLVFEISKFTYLLPRMKKSQGYRNLKHCYE